jgi:DNA-binding NarL/FixJ family response regulator
MSDPRTERTERTERTDGGGTPIRVMLVDDHALVRAAVRQALSASDVEMAGEAATAEEALERAPKARPDVLLVDIDLPGMDGLRLVRELSTRLPETRIVMLTVSTAERDVVDAMRFGASGYLTKDLSPEALLRTVRGVHAGELAMPRRMAARVIRRLVTTAHHGSAVADDDPALASLSAREEEVLRLLAGGLTDRAIADALTISPRTVESHVGSILAKLGVRNRAEAARRYRENT